MLQSKSKLYEPSEFYGLLISGYIRQQDQYMPTSLHSIILKYYFYIIIATGMDSTMLLIPSTLFGMGDNTYNQLGLANGKNHEEFKPVPKTWLGNIIDMSAGPHHTLILTDEGKIYGAGSNQQGQLGLGPKKHVSSFTCIQPTWKGKVIAISTSNEHSIILTDQGEIYVTGSNFRGYLGLGNYHEQSCFTHVSKIFLPPSEKVIAIRAGVNKSVILTNKGGVYGAGPNLGELGLSMYNRNTLSFYNVPINNFKGQVIDISIQYFHSIILTNQGVVYTIGPNPNGQLGLGHTQYQMKFKPVKQTWTGKVIAISAGRHHSIILTDTGDVYTTGSNDFGQLGYCSSSANVNVFQLVKPTWKGQVIGIRAGYQCSIVYTNQYKVYITRQNYLDQLIQTDNKHQTEFTPIPPLSFNSKELYNHSKTPLVLNVKNTEIKEDLPTDQSPNISTANVIQHEKQKISVKQSKEWTCTIKILLTLGLLLTIGGIVISIQKNNVSKTVHDLGIGLLSIGVAFLFAALLLHCAQRQNSSNAKQEETSASQHNIVPSS